MASYRGPLHLRKHDGSDRFDTILSTVEDVLPLCTEVFPDEEVPARARLVLEDTLGDH